MADNIDETGLHRAFTAAPNWARTAVLALLGVPIERTRTTYDHLVDAITHLTRLASQILKN